MSSCALLLCVLALFAYTVTSDEASTCGPDERVARICRGGPITKCSEYLELPGPVDETSCTEGCVCSGSKLYNDDGICIESNDCPELHQCKNDRNAQPSCGRFCNRRCPNHEREPGKCGEECDKDGCECLPTHLYDANLKACVLPESCSPICGPGEVFSHDCIGAGCTVTQCWERNRSPGCYDLIAPACIRGCVCTDGKLRTENGTCVPLEQCPPMEEERCRFPYSRPGCGSNCNQRCSQHSDDPGGCSSGCVPGGCDCLPPFVYDEDIEQCVLPELCTRRRQPPPQTDDHYTLFKF